MKSTPFKIAAVQQIHKTKPEVLEHIKEEHEMFGLKKAEFVNFEIRYDRD